MEEDRIILENIEFREELIRYMKENGITVKFFHVSRRLKKGEGTGPVLDIRFVTAGRTVSIFSGKTKKDYIEILGLRTEEDCERLNSELENG